MEGTESLILLEELLTGKVQTFKTFNKKALQLHLLLSNGTKPMIRAAKVVTGRLKDKKVILGDNYSIMQKYIQKLLSGIKPQGLDLIHYEFSNDLAKRAVKLLFGLSRIQNRIMATLYSSYTDLRLYNLRKYPINVHKRAAWEKVIKDSKANLGFKLTNTLRVWTGNLETQEKNGSDKQKIKLIQYKVIKNIIQKISPGFESIAFFKWKFRSMEFNLIKSRLTLSANSLENLLKSITCKNYLRNWNEVVKQRKNYMINKLKKIFTIAKTRYFYNKLVFYKLWKKTPFKNLSRRKALESKAKTKETILTNLFQMWHVRSFYTKKFILKKMRVKSLQQSTSNREGVYNTPNKVTSKARETLSKLLNIWKIAEIRYFYSKKIGFKKLRKRTLKTQTKDYTIENSLDISIANDNISIIDKIDFKIDTTDDINYETIVLSSEKSIKKTNEDELDEIETKSPKPSTRERHSSKTTQLGDNSMLMEIVSKSKNFMGIPKPIQKKLLRSSRICLKNLKENLEALIKHLVKISKTKKFFPVFTINKWKTCALNFENERSIKLSVIFTLFRMKNLKIKLKKDYINKLSQLVKSEKASYIRECFNVLSYKALQLKESKKSIIRFWRQDIKNTNIRYCLSKIICRIFTKYCFEHVKSRFGFWKTSIYKVKLNAKAIGVVGKHYQLEYPWEPMEICDENIEKQDYNEKGNSKSLKFYHSIVLVTSNYQNRLKQFGMFKIVMFSSFYFSNANTPRSSEMVKIDEVLPRKLSKDSLKEEFQSKIIESKISKEDYISTSQLGAIEIIGFILKASRARKLSWSFGCLEIYYKNAEKLIRDEEAFISEINSLVFDKNSLLNDNASLRMHNEALIDQLEKTNNECFTLTSILSQMKLHRMATVITKMTAFHIINSFHLLKSFTKSNSSY